MMYMHTDNLLRDSGTLPRLAPDGRQASSCAESLGGLKTVTRRSAQTLVLGLGNPLLGDDSAGLRVIQALQSRLGGQPGVELREDYWGGLRLMECMIGYHRAVVVDAICTGAAAGIVHLLSPDALPTRHSASVHDVDLNTALELGRQAGAALPATENIRLVGIEAAEVLIFNEHCTPEVEAGIERAAEVVRDLLTTWR